MYQLRLAFLVAACAMALTGCAVYEPYPSYPAYQPPVVVGPPVGVYVGPRWGYGYGHHHWR